MDDIVGGTIHRFHKDKRRVERILRNPAALPHQAEFSFGDITLQAKINGVFGRNESRVHRHGNTRPMSTKGLAKEGVEAGSKAPILPFLT